MSSRWIEFTRQSRRLLFKAALLASVVVPLASQNTLTAQELDAAALKAQLKDVVDNAEDQPRATPLTRKVMKQYLEDLKLRKPRIPLPEMTEEEKKAALEDPRMAGYEGRLRKQYLPDTAVTNYLPFSGTSNNNPQQASRMGPQDPALSLDYGFKVRLFWIAARANNCQYCLGHQESKLLGVGMTEDQIAALDTEWEVFPESEQAAFALAKRLTLEPHLISDEDIERCRPFYNDLQILEMIGSVAGNNAINRWKEGAGIPQSNNGGGFGSRDRGTNTPPAASEPHSYLTATSSKFENRPSKVVASDASDASLMQTSPTRFRRPPLEQGKDLEAKLASVKNRKPRLPLADRGKTLEVMSEFTTADTLEAWHRLLANFSIAGKRFAAGMHAASQSDALDATLRAKMDWVIARQDRAWYAASLAKQAMTKHGVSDAEIATLDGDLKASDSGLDAKDRALLIVAQKLCASPIVLTDREVDEAVRLAGPRAVTQTINYAAFRAAFDRITEAAGLAPGS